MQEQAGVFLAYAALHGATLLDRWLYLPEAWLSDPAFFVSPLTAEVRLGFEYGVLLSDQAQPRVVALP